MVLAFNLVAFLLLLVMPGAPSSVIFLLLVAMPFAPSSFLYRAREKASSSFLCF